MISFQQVLEICPEVAHVGCTMLDRDNSLKHGERIALDLDHHTSEAQAVFAAWWLFTEFSMPVPRSLTLRTDGLVQTIPKRDTAELIAWIARALAVTSKLELAYREIDRLRHNQAAEAEYQQNLQSTVAELQTRVEQLRNQLTEERAKVAKLANELTEERATKPA